MILRIKCQNGEKQMAVVRSLEPSKTPYEYMKRLPTIHAPFGTRKEIEEEWDAVHEPKILTMTRKVVIEAAIPGWQPKEWYRERGVMSLPPGADGGPTCIEEQVDAIAECVKAGASCIHTHPRDPSDGLCRLYAPKLLAAVMDRAFSQVDFITSNHTWGWDWKKSLETDYISETKELLELGKGNKYVQSDMIVTWPQPAFFLGMPVNTSEAWIKGVKFYEENHIKPMFSVEPYAFAHLKRILFDTNIARSKPYWIVLQMGKHCDDQQFADPWSYIQMINNMSLVRAALPESDLFLGVNPGGRNWLPVTNVAFLYGAQFVRLGLEDQYYLWPHRDDISHKASDTVELVAKLVKAIGREVATVKEAREMMGIDLITKD